MDNITIRPESLKGCVVIPPSKSVAHRAIIGAALSKGKCVIDNIAMNADIIATLNGIRALGSDYKYEEKKQRLTVFLRKEASAENIIDCGESGSTIRFLMPIALLSGKNNTFICHGRLIKRPMKPYFDNFKKYGIEYKTGKDSIKTKGTLKSGTYNIPGDVSSQFITGLLYALPLLDGDSEILITGTPESTGYIDLTLDVLSKFGINIENENYLKYKIKGGQKYKPANITVEADYSQAAFYLVAGAIGCDVECVGLREDSRQGDKEILDIIERAGGKLIKTEKGIKAWHTQNMHGIDLDGRNIPDLIPVVSVMLSFCKGESNITNVGRLRMKESDRLSAICEELSKIGVQIEEGKDYIKIIGGETVNCEKVSARNDHRIAMALAIAACRAEGEEFVIEGGKSAVKKSYPDFFEVYENLK